VTRLLVVEDSETIQLLIRTRLEMAGYDVSTAYNGEEALRLVAEERPDLVLMDVMMPVKSGMEALSEMRSAGDSTPVILCTAHRGEADLPSALEAGADDYIVKPIDFDELFGKIEKLLG
jgi:two-component system response regulator MprA